MKTSDFDYTLPPELIAQTPIEPRDQSRLMVLDRKDRSVQHRRFFQVIDHLRDGDVLVFNDTRVIPARLTARKATGARLEVLLLQRISPCVWETLVRPARRAPVGTELLIQDPRFRIQDYVNEGQECPPGQGPSMRKQEAGTGVEAEVIGEREGGIRVLKFADEPALRDLGEIPLPPYIHGPLADPERYQTVYSRCDGSVAAPTAGLHFTPELIEKLRLRGVRCVFVTLHVGLDTFRPVREEDPRHHPIHREYGIVGAEAAQEVSRARAEGRRVICVGTTSMRLVEAAVQGDTASDKSAGFCRDDSQAGTPVGPNTGERREASGRHTEPGTGGPALMSPFAGWVDLFIVPGHRFSVADAMITNFHLPRTTLLMLVSAFAGREFILSAYREAMAERYRFYSFGDAMMIV